MQLEQVLPQWKPMKRSFLVAPQVGARWQDSSGTVVDVQQRPVPATRTDHVLAQRAVESTAGDRRRSCRPCGCSRSRRESEFELNAGQHLSVNTAYHAPRFAAAKSVSATSSCASSAAGPIGAMGPSLAMSAATLRTRASARPTLEELEQVELGVLHDLNAQVTARLDRRVAGEEVPAAGRTR